jgi:NADH-quinone oxidoreductase subunit G
MCDYGRLNIDYLTSDKRLLEPRILSGDKLAIADWKTAIGHVALQLRHFPGWQTAIIASGRMTNEELWLTAQLARTLGIELIDIVPRTGPGDDILLSTDRNPNANGARLLGITAEPGARLSDIADAVKSGRVKTLLALHENPLSIGISAAELANLPAFITIDILENASTERATAVLPAFAFAEKRGSMINGKGRLQRLNRAVCGPGNARDDWEIMRDLLQALSGSNGIYSIEDVFRQMSESVPQLAELSLRKIGDLGIDVMTIDESPTPPVDDKAKDIEKAEEKRPPQRRYA